MSERNVLKQSVAVLNVIGFIRSETNLWHTIKQITIVTMIVLNLTDESFSLIFNWRGIDSVEDMMNVVASVQLISKLSMLAMWRKEILKTFQKMDNFWPLDKHGEQQAVKNQKIFNFVKLSMYSYGSFTLATVIAYIFKPLTSPHNEPALSSFLFTLNKVPPSYLYVYQATILMVMIPIQFGFDYMFIALITNLVCELKLLKAAFEKFPSISRRREMESRTMKSLIELIDHHNLILDCARSVQNIYYVTLLLMFGINLFAMGFCLMSIILARGSASIALLLTLTSPVVFFTVQLFMFCASGTILSYESTAVSDSVYQIDWWIKTQPQLRRACVMIIQRSNKPVILSAGGLVNVNLQGFTTILRSTYSFYTFMQAFYKKM